MIPIVNIAKDFGTHLTNRDRHQRDGKSNAESFRNKYLNGLYNGENSLGGPIIELDFSGVVRLSPGWADTAFGDAMGHRNPSQFFRMIRISNISEVKMQTIRQVVFSHSSCGRNV